MEGSKGGRKRLLGYEEKVQECVTRKKNRKEKMGKRNKGSKNGGTDLEGGGEEKE